MYIYFLCYKYLDIISDTPVNFTKKPHEPTSKTLTELLFDFCDFYGNVYRPSEHIIGTHYGRLMIASQNTNLNSNDEQFIKYEPI